MKRKTLLIGLVVIAVLLIGAARLYFSNTDFGLDNPYWNGIDYLSTGVNAHPLYDVSGLPVIAGNTTLLVAGPQTNFTAAESGSVLSFLNRGGTVVVMDDFGDANSLLSGIDAPVQVRQVPICDLKDFYMNYSFPIISTFSPSPYFVNVSSIVLNYPASLNVSGSATVLATTSDTAWLDYNDNSKLDGNEKLGTYPVMAINNYSYGGRLIVISDPDILINSMLDKGDNKVFIANLLAGNVLVDVSHNGGVAPLDALYFDIKGQILVQLFLVAIVMACGLAFAWRRLILALMQKLIAKVRLNNINKRLMAFAEARLPLRGKILKK